MEIDVFYTNDDMSFGFDGKENCFASRVQHGFPDVDYSYAGGAFPPSGWDNTSDNVNASGREAQVESWFGIEEKDKQNCDILEGKIASIKNAIKQNQTKLLSAKGGEKRVTQDYLNLYQKRLNFFEDLYSKAKCSDKKSEEEDSKFQGLLNQLTTSDSGNDKMGTYVLIGGVVVVLSVIGLIIYKKSKAS
jgi:hypothetical protein